MTKRKSTARRRPKNSTRGKIEKPAVSRRAKPAPTTPHSFAVGFKTYAKGIRRSLRAGYPNLPGLYNEYWEQIEGWTGLAKKHLKDCPSLHLPAPSADDAPDSGLNQLAMFCDHAAAALEGRVT